MATAEKWAAPSRLASQPLAWQAQTSSHRSSSTQQQPTSVYAKRVETPATELIIAEPDNTHAGSRRSAEESRDESAAATGVRPILAADFDYSPPPALPSPDTDAQVNHTHEAVPPSNTRPIHDPQVLPAAHVAAAPPVTSAPERRLLSSSNRSENSGQHEFLQTGKSRFPKLPSLPHGSLVTTLGAMSTVAGLFFLSIYLVRRGMPQSMTSLPDEVVAVVGRKQLAGRQMMQLVRVGNKLVLLSVTPDGTEPLTEVTDPLEVDRLLGLCATTAADSSTAAFQEVLEHMSRDSAPAGSFFETSGGRRHA